MSVRHLPYQIDEKTDRFAYYETLWKRNGIALLLKHCQPAGKSLLDYGCGRGETLDLARQAGFKVQGADIDPECVRLSRRYGPACALDSAAPLAQFGERSFDVVTCFHVLEHVENPKQVLGAIARIAREQVVLAVPNLRYLHRTFRRTIDLGGVNEGHLQSWDHWHLLNLAERHCGLKLVEWGTDATQLPFLSNLSQRVLGNQATIWLETGLFRKLFPFHGISVMGVFRPCT
jgi:2-polyprenyl-3-methyl-5-hydroxy-6-metoxy-1,4-benzoquinol methylase